MYMKDKTEVLQIRLNKKQMEYLNRISKVMGISKTEIFRGYLDKLMGAQALSEYNKAN